MDLHTEDPLASLTNLGQLAGPVAQRVESLGGAGFVRRFWDRDPSLWSNFPEDQAGVSRRLGWSDSPQKAHSQIPTYRRLAADVHSAGISRFLVLGMGGSSLAAEVMSSVFEADLAHSSRRLGILDSTDPDQVAQAARDFPPDSSLYIVSSKSGGTAEVMAAFEYFWLLTGGDGSRFIAVSDEGTPLQGLARGRGFRQVFTADSTVGGRYSAFTDFGMVPAALLGIDLELFLDRAGRMQRRCGRDVPAEHNPAMLLGALMGEAAMRHLDKLTLIADPEVEVLPNWIEQLVAESSGKDGKGILPIALEPLDSVEVYGLDRLFTYLRCSGQLDAGVDALRHAGFPVLTLDISDAYEVAAEFLRWEIAVAAACHILGVNAFDQPDVQESKDRTQAKIVLLEKQGRVDEGQWDIDLAARKDSGGVAAQFWAFLQQAGARDYVAINAYLPMRRNVSAELQRIRVMIREHTHLATTVGFGPRFQHSTGQLHKGGANNGLFIQIITEPELELPIPAGPLTFGNLIRAQALGDYETLVARKRRVIRVHLRRSNDVALLRRILNEPA